MKTPEQKLKQMQEDYKTLDRLAMNLRSEIKRMKREIRSKRMQKS